MQEKPAGLSPPLNATETVPRRRLSRLQSRVALGVIIFLLAFGVRVLTWHDTRLEVGKVQTSVVGDYQRIAVLVRDGGLRSFFSSSSALADLNNLGHPPGYSILLAAIYSIAGHSNGAIQTCQIIADGLCAVLLFLIVAELLPLSAAVIAGLLAALSPQLAWNSVLLLPDSISVLPILLAVYFLARAVKNPRLLSFLIVGLLIGVSCWLRANFMLLTLFVAVAVLLLMKTKRWQFALAVICGTLLIVLPLTIRNAIVFHRFIPLSLGAGQTFLEGIADYDKAGRLGIPDTDVGIMKQEAEIYQRPEYYGTLFNPDGVERERARLSRGFAVVRSHPVWFGGVMVKRASSMLRLERSRLLSTEPAVTHSLAGSDLPPEPSYKFAYQLEREGTTMSNEANVSLVGEFPWLDIAGDSSTYGDQFASPTFALTRDHDYLAEVRVHPSKGRMRVSLKTPEGKVYSSAIVEAIEGVSEIDQPAQLLLLPFVARHAEPMQIVFSNEASNPPRPSLQVEFIRLYDLGPARFLWTRYPRFLLHGIQKLFITAVMLPLAFIGLLILILRRQTRALLILSVVPIYFFLVQSLVHTEYRYLLAVVYFMFAFAGVTLGCGLRLIIKKLGTISTRSVPSA